MNFNDLKNMKRFKEIMAVLIKYGFEELVQRLDVPGTTAMIKKIHPIDEALVTVWYSHKEILGRIGQIINKLDDGHLDFNFHLAKSVT